MSDRDVAVAMLHEAFPQSDGWRVSLNAVGGQVCSAIASATRGEAQFACSRPWEPVERPDGIMEAVRAVIAARDRLVAGSLLGERERLANVCQELAERKGHATNGRVCQYAAAVRASGVTTKGVSSGC